MKENLKIFPVQWMDQVLELALERMPKPRLAEDVDDTKKQPPDAAPKDDEVPISPH